MKGLMDDGHDFRERREKSWAVGANALGRFLLNRDRLREGKRAFRADGSYKGEPRA